MNKKFLIYVFIGLVIIIYYFRYPIKENIISEYNVVKDKVINIYDTIQFEITSYIEQAEQIKKLKKDNRLFMDYISSITPILISYQKFKEFHKINNNKVVFSKTISYANLPDMTSIYVDYSDNKKVNHPLGLIYNNQAAGIITEVYNNYSLALLNINPKVTYTVFIGKNKIPGIVFGGKNMEIKYIPNYKPIKIGDLVITSGLDRIFYEGVKVGVITSIIHKKLYQEAKIKPFYDSYHPTFFYVFKN